MRRNVKALEAVRKEVEDATRGLSATGKRHEKGPLSCYYIKVPDVRRRAKEGYSFSSASSDELLQIWDHIWNTSDTYEVMSQCLYHYQGRPLTRSEFTKIKEWVIKVTCWEHSDDLSKILAGVTEENPTWIIPALKSWNRSKSPWERRQSIVALMEYSKKREKVQSFSLMISLVENLLSDEDYYVQKAVGWTLREIGNVYPRETLTFIDQNVARISPNAWSSATRKLDKAVKVDLNMRRKA